MYRATLLIYIFLIPHICQGDKPYIITATPLTSEPITGESTIITADEIAEKQNNFIQDVLRDAPSIHISNAGDNGRQTRFAMRGAVGGENLVLIDSIPVNDPAASSGLFDFADLMTDDIETVHILPGTNAVHYGADAMGGVIELTTHAGRGPFKLKAKAEGGSHHTAKGYFSVSGEKKDIALRASLASYRSGKGDFVNKIHHNRQADLYRNILGSSKISYALTADDEIEVGLRESRAHLTFDTLKPTDDFFLPFLADNTQFARHQLRFLRYTTSFCENKAEAELTLSHTHSHRKVSMPFSHFSSSGKNIRLHGKVNLTWCPQNISNLGFEATHTKVKDDFSGKHNRPHQGVFLQHHYKAWTSTEFIFGGRIDFYRHLNPASTYRLAINHLCNNTTFRASYGTGFKAPLLSDMFNISPSAIPNPDLKPERNHSFDIGIDQKFLKDKVETNLTYFENHIDNVFLTKLAPLFKFQRINGGKRKARGVETKARAQLYDQFEVKTNATYTYAKDIQETSKRRSPHIPSLQWNNELVVKPHEDCILSFGTHHVTAQRDAITSQKLPKYTTLDLRGSINCSPLTLYGRVENLTDKRYEQTFGYGVRGRSFYIGIKAEK